MSWMANQKAVLFLYSLEWRPPAVRLLYWSGAEALTGDDNARATLSLFFVGAVSAFYLFLLHPCIFNIYGLLYMCWPHILFSLYYALITFLSRFQGCVSLLIHNWPFVIYAYSTGASAVILYLCFQGPILQKWLTVISFRGFTILSLIVGSQHINTGNNTYCLGE